MDIMLLLKLLILVLSVVLSKNTGCELEEITRIHYYF